MMTTSEAVSLFMAGYFVGTAVCFLITWLVSVRPNQSDEYRGLLLETKRIIAAKGVVTVTELTFAAKVSPERAKKFLDRLVLELDGNVQFTDAGKTYYCFPTADSLSLPPKT